MTWNNSTLLPADGALDAVAELRATGSGDLAVWGSATLVRDLIAHGLVDELRLMIEPILLGGGKRIFPEDGQARPFRLHTMQQAPTGVLVCVYHSA